MDDANLNEKRLNLDHLQGFCSFSPRFCRNLFLPSQNKVEGGGFLEAAMTVKQLEFDQRVHRLTKKHQKLSRGYRATMRKDGLVVMKPQRIRSGIPARVLVLSLVGFFAFKAFLLSSLGPTGYQFRVDGLNEGTSVEKAGAWVMQIDPVSQFLSGQLNKILF